MNFGTFLIQNMLATIVAIAGLIASIVTIVYTTKGKHKKSKLRYIIGVFIAVFIIAVVCLGFQYCMLPKDENIFETNSPSIIIGS